MLKAYLPRRAEHHCCAGIQEQLLTLQQHPPALKGVGGEWEIGVTMAWKDTGGTGVSREPGDKLGLLQEDRHIVECDRRLVKQLHRSGGRLVIILGGWLVIFPVRDLDLMLGLQLLVRGGGSVVQGDDLLLGVLVMVQEKDLPLQVIVGDVNGGGVGVSSRERRLGMMPGDHDDT